MLFSNTQEKTADYRHEIIANTLKWTFHQFSQLLHHKFYSEKDTTCCHTIPGGMTDGWMTDGWMDET